MSLFGMGLTELQELGKKFKENKEFLGLTDEEVAKMLGIPVGEIEYLLTAARLQFAETPKKEQSDG